jgi:Ca-activated chloride channel family protein
VTFAEPILLAGFILVPLAMLAYSALQRRRRRESAAWANPALVPNLVAARPGWRRHLPPALLLLAVCALILAMARPQRTVAAPQRAANIVMVTDISGSMNATDVHPDRLTAAVDAAKTLTDKVPPTFRLGLITFSDYAEQRVSPTTDRSQMKGALDQLVAEGGTAMGDGLERGLLSARTPVPNATGNGVRRLPSVIVLLSDGKNTSGTRDPVEVAREAGAAHIPIYAIALGTPDGEVELRDSFGFLQRVQVPPDTETLKQIAKVSGGKSYTATETDKLKEIYSTLGTSLSSKSEKREVSAFFAGGALALLIAAGSLSLRWFGRLL